MSSKLLVEVDAGEFSVSTAVDATHAARLVDGSMRRHAAAVDGSRITVCTGTRAVLVFERRDGAWIVGGSS